jgi:hypothetical protein
MAREHWRVAIGYGVATYLLLELLFRGVIGIPFPVGIVFDWLDLDPSIR